MLLFSCSVLSDFVTPWTTACQASLSFIISWSLHKLISIEFVMPSNHFILCILLSSCPQFFPALGSFAESLLHLRWPKFKSFSFSIRTSNKYLVLISLKINWFDFFAIQGTSIFSPAPQFESISSLALTLLYSPTLTSVYNCWKHYSFDYTELCPQSDLCFLLHCLGLS